MNWHLPYESRSTDDRQLEEMPRYQFVTNFYQGFGLSFIAVLWQDVPSDLTDQQLANINSQNQQFLNQQQQQTGNLLNSQFQSILNNPGLSSADKTAVTGQSQGAMVSAFDSLQQSATNRGARIGNSAGFDELTDDLARQKAVAEGNQAQQNQLAFTNTAFQRQMSALQGLSGLFGVDQPPRPHPRHFFATAERARQCVSPWRWILHIARLRTGLNAWRFAQRFVLVK